VILLDTHALLWWALDPDKLSASAIEQCARMEHEGGFASSIWELGVKVRNGKLALGLPLADLVRRIEDSSVVELLPVDTAIWVRTATLDWPHRDPADRVIAATAITNGLPILTKDAALHAFAGVRCVW